MKPQWYLVYTNPRQELLVNRQLEDRELETFLPLLQFNRGYGRGVRVQAFFPQYLFVRLDLSAIQASGLQSLMGVRAIVHFDSQAVIVPNAVIQMLRARLDPFQHKVLHKGDWLYQPGQELLIIDGPFHGLEAVFQKSLKGSDRVQVLLSILGTTVPTELSVTELAPKVDQH